jgi:hypothetical protein
LKVTQFEVEFGAMNYKVNLDAIAGLDFLLEIEAVIDLDQKRLYKK